MLERVLARPGDMFIAVAAVALGITSLIDGLTPLTVGPVFAEMAWWLKVGGGALLTLGGVLSLLGMAWHPEQFELSWAIEGGGWAFVAGAGLAYTVAIAALRPDAVYLILAAALTAVAVTRTTALVITVRRAWRVDKAMKELHRLGDE